MKKFAFIIILFATLALALAACSRGSDQAQVIEEPKLLIAEGQLQPVSALDLSFPINGKVDSVFVQNGELAKTNQVLARLVKDPETDAVLARAREEAVAAEIELEEYQASAALNLAEAEIEVILSRSRYRDARNNYLDSQSRERSARYDKATADLAIKEDALERVVANNGLDPNVLDTLQARLDAANAAVTSAEAAVDAHNLRASMAATVVDVSIQPGQQVSAGEFTMALADLTKWIVKTDSLTETEVVQVQVGQPVKIVLDALPDVTLEGVVTNINKRFEEKRGDITYTVTIELKNSDERMRWGMTAAVTFSEVQ